MWGGGGMMRTIDYSQQNTHTRTHTRTRTQNLGNKTSFFFLIIFFLYVITSTVIDATFCQVEKSTFVVQKNHGTAKLSQK